MVAQQRISIAEKIRALPGVIAVVSDGGHEQFLVDRIEIGHLHGDRVAHIPLPRRIHDMLIAAGRAKPHPVLPRSGWIECVIDGEEDVHDVFGIVRMNYYRAITRHARQQGTTEGAATP